MARLGGFVIAGLLAACHHADAPAPPIVRARAMEAKPAAPPARPTRACPAMLVAFAGSGDVSAVKSFLADNRCNGDAFDGSAHTALMIAAERGHLDIVRALLAAGAPVDSALSSGSGTAMVGTTALWYAVDADHPDVVAELLRAGADPDRSPDQGLPLLVLAAQQPTAACAKLLVEAGVSKTAATAKGDTAMTFDGGPSAEVFAYFESVGMASDSVPDPVKASLRWEASHAPKPDAPVAERARFHAEVARTTKSRTARALAIKQLADEPSAIAAPALIAIALGPAIDDHDRGVYDALVALNDMPWTDAADQALPRLLAMLATDHRQPVRLQLFSVLGLRAPASARLVDALIGRLEHGDDRASAASALGEVIRRAESDKRSLAARARPALERAARGPAGPTTQAAREALARLGAP